MRPIRSVLVLGLVALATGCGHHCFLHKNSRQSAAGSMPAQGQMGMGTGTAITTPQTHMTPASTMPSPIATPSLSPAPIPGP